MDSRFEASEKGIAVRMGNQVPRVRTRVIAFALALLSGTACTLAWDAHGHRAITLLALDGMSPGMPAFLREGDTRKMIASQSCEPDRWRSVGTLQLTHVNNPDHYIDAEELPDFGMTLETLPPLRYDYIAAIARARAADPAKFPVVEDPKDAAHVRFTPGTLPHAIAENYAKLQGAFKTLRILESLNDPAREAQVKQARANVIVCMGILSHFVGDGAQPLHMTKHHHGWVGENPSQYTTRYGFHAEIDGGVLELHKLGYDTLKPAAHFDVQVEAGDPMPGVKVYLKRSFDKVEPLYALEKSGGLREGEGKAFITERLTDASAELAALYNAAWESSAPSDEDARNFVRYDKYEGEGAKP